MIFHVKMWLAVMMARVSYADGHSLQLLSTGNVRCDPTITEGFVQSREQCLADCGAMPECKFASWYTIRDKEIPEAGYWCTLSETCDSTVGDNYEIDIYGPDAGNCPRPAEGCLMPDDVYQNIDCDADGLLDHVCTNTLTKKRWVVLSSRGQCGGNSTDWVPDNGTCYSIDCGTFVGKDIASGFVPHNQSSALNIATDAACHLKCKNATGCTAWVRSPFSGRCWLTTQAGKIKWKDAADRNGGVMTCTGSKKKEDWTDNTALLILMILFFLLPCLTSKLGDDEKGIIIGVGLGVCLLIPILVLTVKGGYL